MLCRSRAMDKFKLVGKNGEIGKVKDFYFDDQEWVVRYLIADTGTWLSHNKVLISPHSVVKVNEANEVINISLSNEQIEKSPLLESDKPVSRQFQRKLLSYFNYPDYWGAGKVGFQNPGDMGQHQILSEIEKNKLEGFKDEEVWDPNLRSIHHVRGYHIQSTDEAIGHVYDFLIDESSWDIRYLIIDTNKWLPGKKVIVSPEWINKISWNDSLVFVDLSLESIKNSETYDEVGIIDREYETRLHNHYRKKLYWDQDKKD